MKDRFRKKNRFSLDRILILISGVLCILLIYMFLDLRDEERLKNEELKQMARKQTEIEVTEREDKVIRAELEAKDSFYQKLADGFNVKILVIGDSIGNGRGATSRDHTWQALLEKRLEETYSIDAEILNHAMNDNTAYGGYASVKQLADDVTYDAAVVLFSEDYRPANFTIYYESILRALQARSPESSLITVIENASRGYTDNTRAVSELSEHYGIPAADTVIQAENSQLAYGEMMDALGRPNDAGQQIYADAVFAVMEAGASAYEGKPETTAEPLNEEALYFDTYEYIPAKQFEREGNTFILSAEDHPVNARILGIDYNYMSGDNNCQIYADQNWTVLGQAVFRNYLQYDGDELNGSGSKHYRVMNNWISDWGTLSNVMASANTQVRVVFPENDIGRQQADNFRGLILSGKE